MASLFDKEIPAGATPTPYELINPEIVHLKKGYSIRHGERARKKMPTWLLVMTFGCLAWIYLMDPILHAWYKGEAIRDYLYLRDYGNASLTASLIATGILSAEDVELLNHRHGSYESYYASPDAANHQAQTIIDYMSKVRALHQGRYQGLDPLGRMRYLLFIRLGIFVPTDWSFLDPSVQ
jgi:hypothetical protein